MFQQNNQNLQKNLNSSQESLQPAFIYNNLRRVNPFNLGYQYISPQDYSSQTKNKHSHAESLFKSFYWYTEKTEKKKSMGFIF